jgi:predicted nucleic acid-binding protein
VKLLRVYLDTSVFGGYYDDEYAVYTQRFFECIQEGLIRALLSETLVQELVRAPKRVQDLLDLVRQVEFENLPLESEAFVLRQSYLRAGIVTAKYASDALHVAQATIARADVIASWNFRHLVNPAKMRGFSGVNVGMGYGLVVIMTPAEIVSTLGSSDE